VEAGLERKQAAHAGGGELNHLDRMALDFHQRVTAGYRQLLAAQPDRWRIIDASQPVDAVQAAVQQVFENDVLSSASPSC